MPQKIFDLKLKLTAEPHIHAYYNKLMEKATREITIAQQAKAKGFDITEDIETTPALDLADRTESIIGPPGIAKRYREEFLKTNDRVKAIFTIFQEIIEQSADWYKEPEPEKRLDQGIRTSLVLLTEGVVVAPLDGVPKIKISPNPDGTRYVDIYFAGPIRAAGGTATVFPLILGDFARKLLGLDRYKPTNDEIERYVEETGIYDEIVSRQYKLKPEEVRKIISNCPVCVNGEPTEDREVSVHRDLERIATNQIRGGACLVISEGIALKAMKIIKFARQLGLDWNWLEEIIKIEKKGDLPLELKPNMKFLERMAAGRPIFSYPLRFGGFRLRYGRGRNTGAMGKAIHPATMRVLDDFIAVGTQIKIERPGKSAGITPCDSIEGPIVRLFNGNVLQLNSASEGIRLKPQIDKILFLGDILVPVGDFRKSGHPLIPAGYCEEWWKQELLKALKEGKKIDESLRFLLQEPIRCSIQQALKISSETGVPLHSKFIFYYNGLEKNQFSALNSALRQAKEVANEKGIELELENKAETKSALEKIGCSHEMRSENKIIWISAEYGLALLKTFGILDNRTITEEEIQQGKTLDLLSKASGLIIRDKGGTFIGCRMGRPEAARPRKMIGNPHTLFPIALFGGPTRSINKAANANQKNAFVANKIEVEIALYQCPECKETVEFAYCSRCRVRTKELRFCKHCKVISHHNNCERCNATTQRFNLRQIDLARIAEQACKNLGVKMPDLLKGVKGVINETKTVEPLEKGILRAQKDLHVFRDATIRYEMLNALLTHFKPREIGTSVERLRELGYENDMDGKPLENEEQILELFPQDVVINDESGDFFVRVTQFLDELLVRFYGLPEYYKITKREQLIGELVLGLAPHTSAAVVGRIIGYSKAKLGFAHPFFHLAKRRNIDGDQDSVMLLMDGLLNFSLHYLPGSRGGRMDAPLVFTIAITPNEIDDEAYEIDIGSEYPLELYEKSLLLASAESVDLEIVKKRLGKTNQYSGFKFTHPTTTFDDGPFRSKYVTLGTMEEKIRTQAKLQEKIIAVDFKDSMEIVMVSHFLPDIIGNTRSFSRQNFRCTKCQAKYRRVPLIGKCRKCGGNVILTIAQGSVKKYLHLAKDMIAQYQLSHYLKQRIDLVEEEIDSVFKPEKSKQKSLFEFA